jgi:hypothetical protein
MLRNPQHAAFGDPSSLQLLSATSLLSMSYSSLSVDRDMANATPAEEPIARNDRRVRLIFTSR